MIPCFRALFRALPLERCVALRKPSARFAFRVFSSNLQHEVGRPFRANPFSSNPCSFKMLNHGSVVERTQQRTRS